VSFDRLARPYRLLETLAFGNALQRARTFWIDKIPSPKRALIVGEGNGRFLCELLCTHPKIDIDCVDASERMLDLARTRVRETCIEFQERVRFFHEDVLTWSPSASYDLLVTHFFLDCFPPEEVKQIVQKLGYAAASDAIWLIADFAIPSSQVGGMHARLWLRGMYSFFQITAGIKVKQLVDPTSCLCEMGFARTASQVFRAGMLKSHVYQRGDNVRLASALTTDSR
jgi:ubiquinone/menaquinone biosynthesis C-methylase UbiE